MFKTMVQYRVAFHSFESVTDSLDFFLSSPIYLLMSTILEGHDIK